MHTKQTIAIIGSETLGRRLATELVKGNNRVLLFSCDIIEAAATVTSILQHTPWADIEAMPCSYNASWEADIIILAVRYAQLPAAAKHISEVAVKKIVIIAENSLLKLTKAIHFTSDVETLLPYSKVIKATFTTNQNNQHIQFVLNGRHQEPNRLIRELLEEAGFFSQLSLNWN